MILLHRPKPVPTRNELLALPTIFVGCAINLADVKYAVRHFSAMHMVEWRADADCSPEMIEGIQTLHDMGMPILLTVRAIREGGLDKSLVSWQNRRDVFLEHMHLASMVDVETNDLALLKDVVVKARKQETIVTGSVHFTSRIPSEAQIGWAYQEAMEHADILKMVIEARTKAENEWVKKCGVKLIREAPGRVAFMTMSKRFGPELRPWWVRKGSKIVYSWLANPNPHQLHIMELRQKLGLSVQIHCVRW